MAALLFSCATAPKTPSASGEDDSVIDIDAEEIPEGKIRREPKPIAVHATENQLEQEFKDKLKKVDLKVTSVPKMTSVEKAFYGKYIVTATDDAGAVSGLDITVTWPVGRAKGAITYSTAQLKTDAQGNAVFEPAVPKFAVKDKVTFYPTPVTSSASVVQASYALSVTAPYEVKSNLINYPGGVLYAYDFNENGNPTGNSFALLQALRNSNVNVGNSPVSDTSYFEKPVTDLYKATYDIVGKAYNFMVVAAFRYASPAQESDSGATVFLKAEITCVNMADGSVLLKKTITGSATDKNKWNAEQKCRKQLAEQVADAIIYGM